MDRGRNIQGGKAHTRPEDGVLDSLAAEENVELGRKDDIDQRSTMEQNSEQLAAQRYPVTGRPKYRWHDIMNEFLGKAAERLHRENDLQKTAANKSAWMSMAKDFEKETSLMHDPDIDEL